MVGPGSRGVEGDVHLQAGKGPGRTWGCLKWAVGWEDGRHGRVPVCCVHIKHVCVYVCVCVCVCVCMCVCICVCVQVVERR